MASLKKNPTPASVKLAHPQQGDADIKWNDPRCAAEVYQNGTIRYNN